jgi:hypothetical protein
MADATCFVARMRIATDWLGLEWSNRGDFSADGLRLRAFPEEAEPEFSSAKSKPNSEPATLHHVP